MKIKLLTAIFITLFVLLSTTNICLSQSNVTESHEINISCQDNYLNVQESMVIIGDSDNIYESISFWITDKASEVSIIIGENTINQIEKEDNVYNCNISDLNIKMDEQTEIIIDYKLALTSPDFEKKVLRETESISLKYKGETRYTAENLKENSKFNVKIKIQEQEQTLSIYAIITILLLVVLLVVFTMYYFKKQKTINKTKISGASEEYLTTKKTLLMSILKDVEKQHRSNKISDDTYSKIKEQYKNEAVDAMKKLEDMKKEVK